MSDSTAKKKKMSPGLKKLLFELLAVAAALAVGFIPAPEGLSQQAMWVIASLVWALINWIAKPIPDFVAVLLMSCSWVILKIVPFATAYGSFAGTTVWLLIAALGIGMAVTKSGLLARLALLIMKLFPASFEGQVAALLGSGFVIGPFIPSTTAKITIAGPLATKIGEELGFEDQSKGMTGMWAAMYTGFCLVAPAIISASFFGYMILNLLPQETQEEFTFIRWFVCMIPWAAICLVGGFFLIKLLYKPKNAPKLDKQKIQEMLTEMGPMKKAEKITLVVMLVCVVFWMLERTLGISSTVTAIVGMSVLLGLGIIGVDDYNHGISWSLITFVGGALNLANTLNAVGISEWLGATFGPAMANLTSNIYLFVLVEAVAVLLARFVIVDWMTCFTLFTLVLSPFCVNAGISPWIAGIVSYCMIMPWFVKYQNVNFLCGYEACGGDKRIGYNNTLPYAFAFHALAIAGLLVSVPYWKLLGLC